MLDTEVRHGGHMLHQKRSPSFIFFSLNAIHHSQKTYFFCFSDFGTFGGKRRHEVPAEFVFNIMGYLMMVSERRQHKDVKKEKMFEICLSTQKI